MSGRRLGWSLLDAAVRAAGRGHVDASPGPGVRPATAHVRGDGGWLPLTGPLPEQTATDLALVLPTAVSRLRPDAHADVVGALLGQLADAAGGSPSRAGLVVVLQHDEGEAAAARTLGDALARLPRSVPLTVLTSPVRGKIAALNLAISALEPLPRHVGWVDDDVRLEPGCVAHLLRALERLGAPAAVGATKVPHTSHHPTSGALARAKAAMPSAMNYPHGCALLVSAEVVAGGIPTRYANDDGWICFALLRPDAPDPFGRLVVVPDARVHYTVAGSLGSSVRRLRRQRTGQVLLAADADPARRRCYVRASFLQGVDLLAVRPGRPLGPALAHGLYSWVHVLTSAALVAELALRGAVRRPLRHVAWGSPATLGAQPGVRRGQEVAR